MILRDYYCQNCRITFESNESKCPHCGQDNVKIVFIKPPGIKSESSKSADKALNILARDYPSHNHKPNAAMSWIPEKEAISFSDPFSGRAIDLSDPLSGERFQKIKERVFRNPKYWKMFKE